MIAGFKRASSSLESTFGERRKNLSLHMERHVRSDNFNTFSIYSTNSSTGSRTGIQVRTLGHLVCTSCAGLLQLSLQLYRTAAAGSTRQINLHRTEFVAPRARASPASSAFLSLIIYCQKANPANEPNWNFLSIAQELDPESQVGREIACTAQSGNTVLAVHRKQVGAPSCVRQFKVIQATNQLCLRTSKIRQATPKRKGMLMDNRDRAIVICNSIEPALPDQRVRVERPKYRPSGAKEAADIADIGLERRRWIATGCCCLGYPHKERLSGNGDCL